MPSLSTSPKRSLPMSAYHGAIGALSTNGLVEKLDRKRLGQLVTKDSTHIRPLPSSVTSLRSSRRLRSARRMQFVRLVFAMFERSWSCKQLATPIRASSFTRRLAGRCSSRTYRPTSPLLSPASKWKRSALAGLRALDTNTGSGTRTRRSTSWGSISSCGTAKDRR